MTVATPAAPAASPGNPAPLAPRGSLTLAEAADLYVGAWRGRDSSRVHYLAQWVHLIGQTRLADIDEDTVADGLAHFARCPSMRYLGRDKATGTLRWKSMGMRSPATLNRMRSSLSAVLGFAKRQRLMPKGWVNPVLQVEALPENNARTRFLSTEERSRLLAACKAATAPKLLLLVLMALTTGARRGELLGLRHADIDIEGASAYVRRGKNGEPRVLPLTPVVIRMIEALGKKDPQTLIFCGRRGADQVFEFDTAWRTAMRKASLENFRFHDLRHSCASYLAQSGASLLEIADVLGHKSLDVTRRYSHLTVAGKRALIERQFSDMGAL